MDKVISSTGKEVFPLDYFKIKKHEWRLYEGKDSFADIGTFMWALWGYHVPVYSAEEGWPVKHLAVAEIVFRDDVVLSKCRVIVESLRSSGEFLPATPSVTVNLRSAKLFYEAHPDLGRPPLLFKDARDQLTADALQQEETLTTKERTTFQIIVKALMSIAKIDPQKPSAAAVAIKNEAETLGLAVGVRTIEEKIKGLADVS